MTLIPYLQMRYRGSRARDDNSDPEERKDGEDNEDDDEHVGTFVGIEHSLR